MPRLKEICDHLEQFAPLNLQESYDNAGLILGDEDQEIISILLTLDSLESIVDEAIEKNCQLILAHHPIIFGGLKQIRNSHYVEKTVRKAIKNDIAIYAAHTNLDNIRKGVNKKISDKLELKNPQILKPKSLDAEIGSGMIAELGNEMNEGEFMRYVIDKMELHGLRHTNSLNKAIKKVALCGGAGSFLIRDAIASGADAFISSDIKYHEFFEANNQILILDIGHYESERFTSEIFHKVISEKFPNIALQFSEVDTNPVKYFK